MGDSVNKLVIPLDFASVARLVSIQHTIVHFVYALPDRDAAHGVEQRATFDPLEHDP